MNLEQLIKLAIEHYEWNGDADSLRKLEQSLKELSERAGMEAKIIDRRNNNQLPASGVNEE